MKRQDGRNNEKRREQGILREWAVRSCMEKGGYNLDGIIHQWDALSLSIYSIADSLLPLLLLH